MPVPKIFISATSGDLRSAREKAKNAINDLACLPVEQQHFDTDHRTIEEMLRNKIKDCDALIHIVGMRYGAEPKTQPSGTPRRSYTQLEYYIAKEFGLPVYTVICDDSYPYDECEAEDPELQALQKQHRQDLKDADNIYTDIGDIWQLEKCILKIKLVLEKIKDTLEDVKTAVADIQQDVSKTNKNTTKIAGLFKYHARLVGAVSSVIILILTAIFFSIKDQEVEITVTQEGETFSQEDKAKANELKPQADTAYRNILKLYQNTARSLSSESQQAVGSAITDIAYLNNDAATLLFQKEFAAAAEKYLEVIASTDQLKLTLDQASQQQSIVAQAEEDQTQEIRDAFALVKADLESLRHEDERLLTLEELQMLQNIMLSCETITYDSRLRRELDTRSVVKEAEEMLEKHSDLQKLISGGVEGLYSAVLMGYLSDVETLLKYHPNIDLNSPAKYGQTLLELSVDKGYTEITAFLIDQGGEVNTKNKYTKSMLQLAIEDGHLGTANLLIERGANVDMKDKYGKAPLPLAVASGYMELVKNLLTHNADINITDASGKTPLHIAAWDGRADMVDILISNGADINPTGFKGHTPMSLALHAKQSECAELLKKNGGKQ